MHAAPVSRRIIVTLSMAALAAGAAPMAQTLPVTHGNSTYLVTYQPEEKLLEVASNNTECVWRTEISRSVPSFSSVAAIATAAGPVIIYSETGGSTHFALPHFRTGALTVENSGEPLRGVIGQGLLLNCVMQAEQYGAKVVCQLLEPNRTQLREYKWDINMWGTHRCTETGELQPWVSGGTANSTRMVNSELKFELEVPQGFRPLALDETSMAFYGPTNDLFASVYSDGGATPIEELGDALMAELGVNVQHRSIETLDNGEPALLLMGTGVVNGLESLHVAIVYSNAARTWVLSYTGRADAGDAYMPAFMAMLNSFNPL
jgi:hypothetical protein